MVHQYVTLKSTEATRANYSSRDFLQKRTLELLADLNASSDLLNDIKITSAPSQDWQADVVGYTPDPAAEPVLDELVISYEFTKVNLLQEFRRLIANSLVGRTDPPPAERFTWVGSDPGSFLTDHWCPGTDGLATFGRRVDARRQIGADDLDFRLPIDPARPRVNVVVVDEGLNKAAIEASGNWGGGWRLYRQQPPAQPIVIEPGSADRRSHGMMIARNILDIAPDAVLFDFPLIPRPMISDVKRFTSHAHVAMSIVLAWIAYLRRKPRWSGPWILVNAWAIFDRASDIPLGDYTENTNPLPGGHALNNLVRQAALHADVDFVFAAGNCGAFCPSPRCGKIDRGPDRSIWGANSLDAVITIGAVATNDMWLGFSSQGRGQELLGRFKPDLCAPSQFVETTNPHVRNTGTSAACGLTAGVIAALRRRWNASQLPPQALRAVLTAKARKRGSVAWNPRTGHGVLDAKGVLDALLP